MAAGDPFACFGDDSDSDPDGDGSGGCGPAVPPPAASDVERGRRLAEAYNASGGDAPLFARATPTAPAAGPSPDFVAAAPPFRSSFEDQRARTASLPWPDRPPSYLGPMELSTDLVDEGGGRGYVASRDLPPGTCVLIEEPLVEGWSREQRGRRLGLESVRHLLEGDSAGCVVGCMEELHPRKERVDRAFRAERSEDGSSSAEIDLLDRIQIVNVISRIEGDASHLEEAKALAVYAKKRNIANSDGTPLCERDITRLLLALRYNGFDSGLYLHFAMFNHSEDPNCLKFRPAAPEGGGEQQTNRPEGGGALRYSEARTTLWVRKGEALTLHYVENPREVCHATRRRILYDQHLFDIGDENAYRTFLDATMDRTGYVFNDNVRCNHIFESELVNGKFPPSARDGSIDNDGKAGDGERDGNLPYTHHIEKSLDDLEGMLEELGMVLKLQSNGDSIDGSFDRAAALELTVWELITASKSTLGNDHHLLLSRCRRLHLNAVELLLSQCCSMLTTNQSVDLMARFLPSAQSLLESQRRRLGRDHPDVARTCGDLSMGVQALLSHSPKRLLSLGMEGMGTLDGCSWAELSWRREKERIERLYPRDAEEILQSVREK